jgi:hypothetical protein
MERVYDFMRMILYLIMAVVLYFGVNQLLVVTEPWAGQSLVEVWRKNLAMAQSLNTNEADLIDSYLATKGSPLSGQGYNFVKYGEEFNVSPLLMVAMTGAESNFGQVGYAVGSYNAVGLGIHEGRRYVSWEEGIEDMAMVLRNYYLDEGRDDPVEIQNKWAPRCVDGNACNDSWAENVKYFLDEMNKYSELAHDH